MFCVSASSFNAVWGDGTEDQGQIFSTSGVLALATDDWSQSVTTGLSGQLLGIEFQFEMASIDLLPSVFEFSIYDGGNPPLDTPLFGQQLTITETDLENPRLYTWDISGEQLHFQAGDVFTVAFRAMEDGFEIAGNDNPGYPGGELFKNDNPVNDEAGDIAFLTYVCVAPLGDVNLDGEVNLLDVQPFVDLLTSGSYQAEADINQDGVVNLLDVQPFVDLLSG